MVEEPLSPQAIEIDAEDYEIDEMDYDEDFEDYKILPTRHKGKEKATERDLRVNKWIHDPEWVTKGIESLMPPPFEANPSATMAVQRELKAMLKEQESARSLDELGWYMPQDLIGDNLFQWIVEMHSFDDELPVAKDMKSRCVVCALNSFQWFIKFPLFIVPGK